MSKRLAIVLAAGKGTRMNSELPKVLVRAHGRPLIDYVLDALSRGGIDETVVVVGYRSNLVREALAERPDIAFVEQTEQLGTGHAVQVCRDHLAGREGPVLIVTGDSPLVQSDSVAALVEQFENRRLSCILGTLKKEDPQGLGRIVRDSEGRFVGIVEEKDATEQQRAIAEVNMSTYVFRCPDLLFALDRLTNENKQGEYYITDCPAILKESGRTVDALPVLKPCEALSVNTVEDLTRVEAEMTRLGMTGNSDG